MIQDRRALVALKDLEEARDKAGGYAKLSEIVNVSRSAIDAYRHKIQGTNTQRWHRISTDLEAKLVENIRLYLTGRTPNTSPLSGQISAASRVSSKKIEMPKEVAVPRKIEEPKKVETPRETRVQAELAVLAEAESQIRSEYAQPTLAEQLVRMLAETMERDRKLKMYEELDKLR